MIGFRSLFAVTKLPSCLAQADTLLGVVVGVADGDTICAFVDSAILQ